MPKEIAQCETTGRKFRYTYKGKRRRVYIDADARRLQSYLAQTAELIRKLGDKHGFTESARKDIRKQLRMIANSKDLSLSVKRFPSNQSIVDVD